MDVDLYQDRDNQLEAGWFDLVDQSQVATTCQYAFSGSNPRPHKAVIQTYHGFQTCYHAGQTLGTGNHGFRIEYNPNCPGAPQFDFYFDGQLEVSCIIADFGSNFWAFPHTNAERYGLSDNLADDFAGLQYLTTNGWQDFDSWKVCDGAVDYSLRINSPTEIESVSDSDPTLFCNI